MVAFFIVGITCCFSIAIVDVRRQHRRHHQKQKKRHQRIDIYV